MTEKMISIFTISTPYISNESKRKHHIVFNLKSHRKSQYGTKNVMGCNWIMQNPEANLDIQKGQDIPNLLML